MLGRKGGEEPTCDLASNVVLVIAQIESGTAETGERRSGRWTVSAEIDGHAQAQNTRSRTYTDLEVVVAEGLAARTSGYTASRATTSWAVTPGSWCVM